MMFVRRMICWVVLLTTMSFSSRVEAAVVGFDQAMYSTTVGAPVSVSVTIRYEAGDLGDLFSYGVKMGGVSGGNSALKVLVADPLGFDGVVGPGANAAADRLAVKGTVDLGNDPIIPYTGSEIATFELLFNEAGEYPLSLEPFNTLGSSEAIWVSGNGTQIDADLSFGATTVTVAIPEPSSLGFFLFSIAVVFFGRKRDLSERLLLR